MYWLFTDETNLDPAQGRFFIYGGLILHADQLVEAHDAIVKIRQKYGYGDNDQFKFQTASRPAHISIEAFAKAKEEAIVAASDVGGILLTYVVLHDIARSNERHKTLEFALNVVLAHFDMRFLTEQNDFGVVCLDRVQESFGYPFLRAKFQDGLNLPDGRSPRLGRIMHYSMSCDGASHFSSMVDIALGGFRYCVNAAAGIGKGETAAKIFPPLAKMMWHERKPDGTHQIGGYGFLAYPKVIRAEQYKAQYRELTQTLTTYANR